jgi:hypothetical protein
MTDLASRVLFKLPTLTVNRMEEAQLVERRASVEDGRWAIAWLTGHPSCRGAVDRARAPARDGAAADAGRDREPRD